MEKKKKRALVFEPNPYHYTLLPSYIYYLNQLGYEVTLLVRDSFSPNEELLSVRGGSRLSCNVVFFRDPHFSDIDLHDFCYGYDLVWITSLISFLGGGKRESPLEILGVTPDPPDGLFGTVHDAVIEDGIVDKDKFAQLFVLKPPVGFEGTYKELSVSYYGDFPNEFQILERAKTDSLASVGVSLSLRGVLSPIAKEKTKDVQLGIIGARANKKFWIESMIKQPATFLLKKKDSFWRGMLPLNPITQFRMLSRVSMLGRLGSSDMYEYLDGTKFLVAAFEGDQLELFSKQRMSGIALLSLGLCIPMIVNQSVAMSWGFSKDECVMYPDNDFSAGLSTALTMDEMQYLSMSKRLMSKADRDRSTSLEIIKIAIEKNRTE